MQTSRALLGRAGTTANQTFGVVRLHLSNFPFTTYASVSIDPLLADHKTLVFHHLLPIAVALAAFRRTVEKTALRTRQEIDVLDAPPLRPRRPLMQLV